MWKKAPLYINLSIVIFVLFSFLHSGIQTRKNHTQPRYGGIFRLKSFANTFKPELDPASQESFIFISEQIYDGLVKLDKNFNIVPSLAEYWEISSDGKRYKFILRKRTKFHHGQELSAEDVKFSLERLLDKKTDSPYFQFFLDKVVGAKDFRAGRAAEVAGFRVLDKDTFEIHWTRPYISALYLMSMHFCKILPKDLVLEKGKGFFSKPSGTGPFKFDYWLRTTRLDVAGVRLVRNDEYFGERPYLKAVEFCPLYSLGHFLGGEIDSIPILSKKLLESDYQIFQDGSLHNVFLGMSCHIPPLDKPLVRKAISRMIDKREIVRTAYEIRALKQVINNFIPSKLPGFFPSEDKRSRDLDTASKLLQQAGYSSYEMIPCLTLFLDLPKTDLKTRISREIKKQLKVSGIELKIDYYRSPQEIRESRKPYLIMVGRLMNFPDPEDIIRPLFFSSSLSNLFGYQNPALDSLLLKAEVEKSWTKRINLFHRMEEILSADMPAIPLFSQQNRVAMQPYVRGVEVPPLGMYYLKANKIWLYK